MLLAMLLIGCEDATPSWNLFEPFGVVEPASAGRIGSPTPPALKEQQAAAEEDLESSLADAEGGEESEEGYDNPWGPNADQEPFEVVVPEPSAEEPTVEEATVDASAPAFGLPNSAAWGVRLLGTIPNAQPPRAALGLPDGTEVVVVPGSMLPSVGMVVITVGRDIVQVARVSPAGDHAEVEMVNLVAQYARTGGSGE